MKSFFLSVFLIFQTASILLGQRTLELNIDGSGIITPQDKLMPHYMYSNNWGIISPAQESALYMQVGGSYQIFNYKKFELKTGISGIIKNKTDESILHQAYLRARLFKTIDISIGKEAYSPISYNDTLTVGGFLINNNSRPIPKVIMGIYEYFPIAFTKNWVEIKGGITHGWLNDDRTKEGLSNSAQSPYLHEKWAYIRLGNTKYQPFAGLVHNSIYGGTRPNGRKIPIDYVATFFGKGSEKIGGGEAFNAAGAHEGFWDFGFYTTVKWADILVYIQRPFADGSGMKIWEPKNRDFKIGGIFNLHNFNFIEKFAIEIIRTDYQSGPGLPDPIYPEGHPKDGEVIFLDKVDDYDAFMFETFGETTNGWGKDDVMDYLVKEQNHGYNYGGRDDYNNNGSYHNGWTYHDQLFGMPLYHSQLETSLMDPEWIPNNAKAIKNTRVRAFHLGMEGQLITGFDYLLKFTFTNNLGSYSEEYIMRYSWTKKDDFLYESGKNQTYSQLQLNYTPKKLKNMIFKTSLSFDTGELYQSFGVMAGLSYSVRTQLKKVNKE